MVGYKLMYSYRGKIAGMAVAASGLLLMLIHKLTHFSIFPKLNEAQHFNIFFFVMLAGLFTMMFSMEKYEDERIKAIRAKAMSYVILVLVASTLAFAINLTIFPDIFLGDGSTPFTKDDVVDISRLLMFYPAVGLATYFLVFYIGIYADRYWNYDDNTTWRDVFTTKNIWFRILFFIVSMGIIQLVFKLIE